MPEAMEGIQKFTQGRHRIALNNEPVVEQIDEEKGKSSRNQKFDEFHSVQIG